MVSIIIPIYNLAFYLKDCLDSCLNQVYPDFEVVCVDDGSTDQSADIVRTYVAIDSRIRLIQQKNAGVVSARNTGISASHGEYLYFLDGDDVFLPDTLDVLVKCAEQTDADIVRGNYITMDDSGKDRDKGSLLFSLNLSNGNDLFKYLCNTGTGAIWNNLIKKELYVRYVNVPIHLAVGEDLYALLQLSRVVKRVVCVDEVTYRYRVRSTSVMNTDYQTNIKQADCFVQRNIQLCNALFQYAREESSLARNEKIDVELMACDKMVNFIFSTPYTDKTRTQVQLLYRKLFLNNKSIQFRLLKRSWKCYLSVLRQGYKI